MSLKSTSKQRSTGGPGDIGEFPVEIRRRESKMCPLIIAASFIADSKVCQGLPGLASIDSNDWRYIGMLVCVRALTPRCDRRRI